MKLVGMGLKNVLAIGDSIQSLTILDLFRDESQKQQKWRYKCLCVCGNICEKSKAAIDNVYKRGIKDLSCGCKYRQMIAGKNSSHFTGYEEVSGNYVSTLRRGLRDKNKRNGTNLEFTITAKYLWELFLKQDRKCRYTGLEIVLNPSKDTIFSVEQTASVDRIDSSKGYIPGNVQWVHKWVNLMKCDFSEEEFLNYCKLINDNMKLGIPKGKLKNNLHSSSK